MIQTTMADTKQLDQLEIARPKRLQALSYEHIYAQLQQDVEQIIVQWRALKD
jgi:hypothetical protein